jgi:C1A family cysteine protease
MIYAMLTAAQLAATPTGEYKGSKSILGVQINADLNVKSATSMDFSISGAVSISCSAETYAYDGSSTITIPGMSTAGDCVHDAIAQEPGLSIKSITYDSSADTITVEAKESFIGVSIVLSKSSGLSMALSTETAKERDDMFKDFMIAHGRTYTSVTEMARRRAVFDETLDSITRRNADGELGLHWINKFADVSAEEFRATHMGYLPKANTTGVVEMSMPLTASASASSIDWRTKSPKILTPVKDQGQCGSCWAFSATEQIETNVAMATGHLYTLSPQQIVSCDKTDLGCNGGNTETAYQYVKSKGLEPESAYPYKSGRSGRDGSCTYQSSETQVSIGGYSTVSSKKSSEGKMLTQIQTSPISVCVDASSWQTYTRGVLGRSCGTSLDHCVQAVGYNAANNYWIVRNSWNTDWGVNGYVYVKEGIDACGIAKDATIVTGAHVSTVEA